MLNLYKILLGPLLIWQGRKVRRTVLRLEEAAGPRSGQVHSDSDLAPIRMLFVGDSSAAGVGVAHQSQALAAQAAERLGFRMGRTVQWHLVARSGVSTREAADLVAQSTLGAADVLVTALGANDVTAQRSARQFLADYQTLLAELRRRTGAEMWVVTGLPPLHILPAAPQPLRWYLGQCARRLDLALRAWVSLQTSAAFVSLQWAAQPQDMAIDGYHPGPGQYSTWAAMVATSAEKLLRSRA